MQKAANRATAARGKAGNCKHVAVKADYVAADSTRSFTIAQSIAASTAGCEACGVGTIKSCYEHEEKHPAATCILWRKAA